MQVRLVISDLDGTLLDTEEANVRAYTEAFHRAGLTFPEAAYRQAFGLRFDALVARVAPGLADGVKARIKRDKAELYRAHFDAVRVNTALLEFLRLSRRSMKVGLATTASRTNAMALLDHFGLAADFDLTLFGEDVSKGKPDPECYVKLIAKAGVDPGACLVFEDSSIGIDAARAAGATVVEVVWP